VTTDQVLSGVGLIVVLAVGCQVLASRLRIPALIIVLPTGFIAGALTGHVNPERLLGRRFSRWCRWRWPSSCTTPGSGWSLTSCAGIPAVP
jgi:hypothetical protein